MRKLASSIDLAMARIENALMVVCQWALFIMALIIFYEVVMNYIFHSPTIWVFEISGYLLLFMSLMPAALIQRDKGHIKMDFLFNKLPTKPQIALGILFCLCIGAYAFLVTWMSANMVARAIHYGMRADTLLRTPLAIPYIFIPIGMGFLVLQAIIDIIKLAGGIKAGVTTKSEASS